MREIPLSEAARGDVLREDVRSSEGVVLLPAGSELTPGKIDQLRARGVEKVVVERLGDGGEGDSPSEGIDRAIRELDHMFSDHRGDPRMESIHEVARAMIEKARPRA